MMASNKPASSTANQHHRSPVKGILKTSKSFEKHETPGLYKATKFDEMNVQLTHHPANKDYGHMKINEPKTPFHYADDVNVDELDANLLAEKLEKTLTHSQFIDRSEEDSDDDQIIETEEELQKRREFERRRKLHYNEFEEVMRARQLMEQDEDEDIEVDDPSPSAK